MRTVKQWNMLPVSVVEANLRCILIRIEIRQIVEESADVIQLHSTNQAWPKKEKSELVQQAHEGLIPDGLWVITTVTFYINVGLCDLHFMVQWFCLISPTYMYIYLIRLIYVTHWSIIATMMFIHQIILKIFSKITRPWNIGHVDLYSLWGQCLGHTLSLSENMTLMPQIVLEI